MALPCAHHNFLKQFDLKCPNPANIRKRRLEFTPELLKGPNEGIWVNLYDACKLVTKETIVHHAKDNFDKLVNEDPVNWLLDVDLDCGFDGSGLFKVGISGCKFIYFNTYSYQRLEFYLLISVISNQIEGYSKKSKFTFDKQSKFFSCFD